jgi:carbamoylphosphate synthase large subunit
MNVVLGDINYFKEGTLGKIIKILVPEGSSLSAYQAIASIGKFKYIIDICDPNPICICRFSKYVRKFHRCPPMGSDPVGYFEYILKLLENEKYDVLLPIHENAYLFSRKYDDISKLVHIAIADFTSFKILQSKVGFAQLLKKLNLPSPCTTFAMTLHKVQSINTYPFYLKLEYGTAGMGTWLINKKEEKDSIIDILSNNRIFENKERVLIQEEAEGILCVAQSLFNKGKLVNVHCYQQRAAGVGGSASAKISVHHPIVHQHLRKLGRHMKWHGSLMIDYIYNQSSGEVKYIEANPRPGETMNSTLSGFNAINLLIQLSLTTLSSDTIDVKKDIKTHAIMAVLMGMSVKNGSRMAVLKEITRSLFNVGLYKESEEEMSRINENFISIIPLLYVIIRLLINPKSVEKIAGESVSNYSLSFKSIKIIDKME